MSDYITGIAVLNREAEPEELIVKLIADRNGEKQELIETLAVYPEGGVKTQEPMWKYRKVGNTLVCSPSLSITVGCPGARREIFHNEHSWTVRFEEYSGTPEAIMTKFLKLNGSTWVRLKD